MLRSRKKTQIKSPSKKKSTKTTVKELKLSQPTTNTPPFAQQGADHFLNYVRVGARLQLWEWLPLSLSPIIWLYAPSSMQAFFLQNALCQLFLFLFVVQIPCYRTERMAYVDIGWPTGLVVVAVNAYLLGDGLWLRKALVCGALALHGLRMSLGGIVTLWAVTRTVTVTRTRTRTVTVTVTRTLTLTLTLTITGGIAIFGQQTNWSYRFERDLPRYEYAKVGRLRP